MSLQRMSTIGQKIEKHVSGLPSIDRLDDALPDLMARSRAIGRAMEGPRQEALRALDGLSHDARRVLEGLPSGVQRALEELPKALDELPKALEELPKTLDELPRALEQLPKTLEQLPKTLDELPNEVQHALASLSIGRPARRRGPDPRVVVAGVAVAGLAIGVLIGRTDRRRIRRLADRVASAIGNLGRQAREALSAVLGGGRDDEPTRPEPSTHERIGVAREGRPVHAVEVATEGPTSGAGVTGSIDGRPALATVETGSAPDRSTGS
jgi:hypothetical protein